MPMTIPTTEAYLRIRFLKRSASKFGSIYAFNENGLAILVGLSQHPFVEKNREDWGYSWAPPRSVPFLALEPR